MFIDFTDIQWLYVSFGAYVVFISDRSRPEEDAVESFYENRSK